MTAARRAENKGLLRVNHFHEMLNLADEHFSKGGLQDKVAPYIYDEDDPMFVLSVKDFMDMSREPKAHQQLLADGAMIEWVEGMFCAFLSHQWLSFTQHGLIFSQHWAYFQAVLAYFQPALAYFQPALA